MSIIESVFNVFEPKDQPIQRYNPKSIPGVHTKNEKISWIEDEFNSALEFEQDSSEDNSDAWQLYSGFDDGQWPEDIKSQLNDEGRNPFQGNFIRTKVDGLAGGLIKNYLDMDFEPVNGEYQHLTRLAKELFHIDKDVMRWDAAYKDLAIDGVVFLAIGELYISDRIDPLGNIGFRRIMPGHIILDPHWLSNDSRDLKRLWKVGYLTAEEIKQKYKTVDKELDVIMALQQRSSTDFDNGDTSEGYPHYNLASDYGSKFRVIEYHHMQKEKKTVEIYLNALGEFVVVPNTGDNEFKQKWAEINQVDLENDPIKKTIEQDIYYVSTIAPQLNRTLLLEDRRSNIQIGRLPFFPWSAGRINGRNSGIPMLLKSVQQTYNKRESLLDSMIASSANGAMAMDPNIVDGNEGMKQAIEKNWNVPNFKFWTAPGAIESGKGMFQELPKGTPDYRIVEELNRMIALSDRLSKQPAVMEGRSEGSEDRSGILNARKQMQVEVTQATLTKSVEYWWDEIGEGYLLLAKQLYSGAYREMKVPGEDRTIELNKPVITPSGEEIMNDFSQLPRSRVIVTQSPEGATIKDKDRAINVEILRVIGPENPVSRAQAVRNVMGTLNGTKAERKRFEQTSEIEMALAMERAKTETLQLQAAQMQIQAQLGGGGAAPPGAEGQQQGPQDTPGNPQADLAASDRQLVNQTQ